MAKKTYLFYDLETTGLDVSFDQIVQFAAILTDENLNELKRYNFLVKLNPDTIPSAYASITHQVSIQEANAKGLSEYEAVKKIHQLLNQPDTISIGYNTLGFDDEFLRFSFYRNLLDPYQHQYKDGCMRMDIYPMTIMYYLHDSSLLNWPKNEDGHISFKLENINKANQLVTEGRAHDALTDVEVTVELAKKLKSNQAMWQYLENLFTKRNDQNHIEKLDQTIKINDQNYTKGLLTNGKFGARNHYQSIAIFLGQHKHYKNQYAWLRLDLEELPNSIESYLVQNSINTQDSEIITDTFQEQLALPYVQKKFGETPFILPLLDRFKEKLPEKKNQFVEKNTQWLNENPQIIPKLTECILNYKHPTYEHVDCQSSLYSSGFLKPYEKQRCDFFHQQPLNKKVNTLNQLNGDLKERALRIIGRLNPHLLTPEQLTIFQNHLENIIDYDKTKRPLSYKGTHARGLDDVYNEIESLKETQLDETQLTLLEELSDYLNI
ncbi:exodeoxyribonuclease I [Thiotrichales bacterium 19S11-10]|nr:exodeoxyribonuclease I [Thiotrichales bacterium 19S11-10]